MFSQTSSTFVLFERSVPQFNQEGLPLNFATVWLNIANTCDYHFQQHAEKHQCIRFSLLMISTIFYLDMLYANSKSPHKLSDIPGGQLCTRCLELAVKESLFRVRTKNRIAPSWSNLSAHTLANKDKYHQKNDCTINSSCLLKVAALSPCLN